MGEGVSEMEVIGYLEWVGNKKGKSGKAAADVGSQETINSGSGSNTHQKGIGVEKYLSNPSSQNSTLFFENPQEELETPSTSREVNMATSGKIIGRRTERQWLYYVDEVVTQQGTVMLAHGSTDREAWLWHRRLGHPSTREKEYNDALSWLKWMSSSEETSHTLLPQSTDPGNSTTNDDLSIPMSKVRNPQTQECVNSPTDSPTVSPTLSDANIDCKTYENNESPESSNNETEQHPSNNETKQHSSKVDQIEKEPVRYELPPRTNREQHPSQVDQIKEEPVRYELPLRTNRLHFEIIAEKLASCSGFSCGFYSCAVITSNPTSSANPTPKGRIRRSSKQKVENSHSEENLTPVDTMTDNRTMAQMLQTGMIDCKPVDTPMMVNQKLYMEEKAKLADKGRSSSKLARHQTSNPTSSTNPTPKATMTDNRTMAEMLRAPTEGCVEAIVVPSILAEQFELKHSLINIMTSEQFFGLEKDNPHDHIRAARRWLKKEPPRSITTWDDLVSKFINEFFPPSRNTNLHNEISNFNRNSMNLFMRPEKDIKISFVHQDSLNTTAGGNLLEKSPQDALTIIENKSKVRNSRSKPIASPVNACDNHSSSEIAKLTHAVNQQTSDVTTAMTAMLKQLQSNPPPVQVKAVKEICVTCGGAHPYYQCLAAGGNTFLEFRDNIQGYVLAVACNYNQGNPGYRPQGVANQMRPPGSGTLPGNTVANPKGKLKAIITRSGLVTDGPTVPTPPKSVNPKEDECVEETYTDPDLAEYTIKALVLMPKYQKMLKGLLSNKEKLQELANTPLNENCSTVILKKLPKKLKDPGKFIIPCGFSELKCKALADLGASINLMPLSVWIKLGLPDLIPTRMTLELANCAICTPDGIARDVFVLVGKFTFPADFVIVDYESDLIVPLILGRPFLRIARALIDVHGEEMILRDGDERLTLNMKHDTTSYSNHPHRKSVNLINIFNIPNIDFFNDIHPHFDDDPLSDSTTYSANSLLEEFTDELALIIYPPDYDDNRTCDIESDLREIEFLLYHGEDFDFKDSIDQSGLTNRDDLFGGKIKEAELLIDQLDLPCDILSEYDSFNSQDFSRDDDLPSPDNEDKVFNPEILIHEKSVIIITRVAQEKKLAISYASLLFEDFDPPFCELFVFKEVPNSMRLLSFSSENEEKVFKPGIYTSEKVKEYQKKDKIGSKLDKNGKRGEAEK
nr:reverse transcriptase domain-containing protein [Tanacetum cinerariifolium]